MPQASVGDIIEAEAFSEALGRGNKGSLGPRSLSGQDIACKRRTYIVLMSFELHHVLSPDAPPVRFLLQQGKSDMSLSFQNQVGGAL